VKTQRLATRDEDANARRGFDQSGDLVRPLHNLLEVVDHEERLLGPQVVGQRAIRIDRRRDCTIDSLGIRHRRERHPPDAVLEALYRFGRSLQREPRLAGPSGTDERHEPMLTQPLRQLFELPLAPDQRSRLDRQVRLMQRLQRRKRLLA
jgi:hypothetical protein